MARYVSVINLYHRPVRIGKTNIPSQKNNASPPAPARVDLASGQVRKDLAAWGQAVQIVGGYTDGVAGRSMPWVLADTDLTTPLSTGQIRWTPLQLSPGVTISTLAYTAGATGAGTPTHSWACVATDDGNGNFVIQATSPDALTAIFPSNSTKTYTLSSPYVVQSTGAVTYAGLMMAATTPPTLIGHVAGATAVGASILPGKNGNDSTTGRTGVLTVGTSISQTNTTNDGKVPYVVVA